MNFRQRDMAISTTTSRPYVYVYITRGAHPDPSSSPSRSVRRALVFHSSLSRFHSAAATRNGDFNVSRSLPSSLEMSPMKNKRRGLGRELFLSTRIRECANSPASQIAYLLSFAMSVCWVLSLFYGKNNPILYLNLSVACLTSCGRERKFYLISNRNIICARAHGVRANNKFTTNVKYFA